MKHHLHTLDTPPSCRHWPFWVVIAALAAVLGFSLLINLLAVGALAGSGTSV
ncbi:MAG: hypothetical protein GX548_04075, partial [Lentisphaerae bacterium]|nr:hypothetical protein [Lentisphaerota bacterium]